MTVSQRFRTASHVPFAQAAPPRKNFLVRVLEAATLRGPPSRDPLTPQRLADTMGSVTEFRTRRPRALEVGRTRYVNLSRRNYTALDITPASSRQLSPDVPDRHNHPQTLNAATGNVVLPGSLTLGDSTPSSSVCVISGRRGQACESRQWNVTLSGANTYTGTKDGDVLLLHTTHNN